MSATIPFKPTITQAGLSAARAADLMSLKLAITHVSFGTGQYAPADTMIALQNEVKRVAIAGGGSTAPTQIQLFCELLADAGSPFWCGEVGFWAGTTLFAVYSRVGAPLLYVSDEVSTTASYSILLSALPANSVTVTVDVSISQSIALLAAHQANNDAHAQYLKRSSAELYFVGQM